ncbi:hypothetical protein CAPTEDRAFT_205421 [Capitella teleta]|uniref:Uncharacterized protein n=1 Tax=Capitella teleta TaxID=283909 RepID=R7TDH2_CAPTE|nr:hypothetical protein CAPTEDRAFT_205421 [Capitella teleta]|eukprot:ELT91778.1 hypothetical protein CAPTEDRAFT_205421 [Capitella teleta]
MTHNYCTILHSHEKRQLDRLSVPDTIIGHTDAITIISDLANNKGGIEAGGSQCIMYSTGDHRHALKHWSLGTNLCSCITELDEPPALRFDQFGSSDKHYFEYTHNSMTLVDDEIDWNF